VDEVFWTRRRIVGHRGDLPRATTNCAAQAHVAHQPLDGATGHWDVLANQLPPDLLAAVDGEVFVEDAAHLRSQIVVALRAVWTPLGVTPPTAVLVVRRRGDRQHGADRLDPVGVSMLVDEVDHHRGRRSSSA
jgi:hypothetical protein